MPPLDIIRQLAEQFVEQFKSRQERFAPNIEDARLRYQEAMIGVNEAHRARQQADQNVTRARRASSRIPGQKQVVANVKVILDASKQRLQQAKAAGAPKQTIKQYEKQVHRDELRVKEAQNTLREYKELKTQLPELKDILARREMDLLRSTKIGDQAGRGIDQASANAGIMGALRDGLGLISQGVMQGSTRGHGIEGLGSVLQGVGTAGNAIPGIGTAGAALSLAGSLVRAVGALDRWTKSVTDSAIHLGQPSLSPGMSMVQAIQRYNEQLNQFQRDEGRYSEAGATAMARSRFERAVSIPIENAYQNAVDRASRGFYNATTRMAEGDIRAGAQVALAGTATAAGTGLGMLGGAKAGALTLGAAGAALGSIIPGAGTAAGALVGGTIGAIGGAIGGAYVGGYGTSYVTGEFLNASPTMNTEPNWTITNQRPADFGRP